MAIDQPAIDFDIDIFPGTGSDYPVKVRSTVGEASSVMHFPFDKDTLENRLKDLQIALLKSTTRRRGKLSLEERNIRDFGSKLFDALFNADVRGRYEAALTTATNQGKGLRLKFHIQPPELAYLPWEYLYDLSRDEYLCLAHETPIVRYIERPKAIESLSIELPLRILGMVSSPSDMPQLEVENEKIRIEKALQNLQESGIVSLTWLNGSSWRELQGAMRKGPWHIFHFIGHGYFDKMQDEGQLAFCNDRGMADYFSATAFARVLRDHKSLRLVFMNACESAMGNQRDVFSSVAATLVKHSLPAVLAMQYEITDVAAVEFARTFYEALVDNCPVDIAVTEARKAITFAHTNSLEWGTPVLYLRASDSKLFDITQVHPIDKSINTKHFKSQDWHDYADLHQFKEDGMRHFQRAQEVETQTMLLSRKSTLTYLSSQFEHVTEDYYQAEEHFSKALEIVLMLLNRESGNFALLQYQREIAPAQQKALNGHTSAKQNARYFNDAQKILQNVRELFDLGKYAQAQEKLKGIDASLRDHPDIQSVAAQVETGASQEIEINRKIESAKRRYLNRQVGKISQIEEIEQEIKSVIGLNQFIVSKETQETLQRLQTQCGFVVDAYRQLLGADDSRIITLLEQLDAELEQLQVGHEITLVESEKELKRLAQERIAKRLQIQNKLQGQASFDALQAAWLELLGDTSAEAEKLRQDIHAAWLKQTMDLTDWAIAEQRIGEGIRLFLGIASVSTLTKMQEQLRSRNNIAFSLQLDGSQEYLGWFGEPGWNLKLDEYAEILDTLSRDVSNSWQPLHRDVTRLRESLNDWLDHYLKGNLEDARAKIREQGSVAFSEVSTNLDRIKRNIPRSLWGEIIASERVESFLSAIIAREKADRETQRVVSRLKDRSLSFTDAAKVIEAIQVPHSADLPPSDFERFKQEMNLATTMEIWVNQSVGAYEYAQVIAATQTLRGERFVILPEKGLAEPCEQFKQNLNVFSGQLIRLLIKDFDAQANLIKTHAAQAPTAFVRLYWQMRWLRASQPNSNLLDPDELTWQVWQDLQHHLSECLHHLDSDNALADALQQSQFAKDLIDGLRSPIALPALSQTLNIILPGDMPVQLLDHLQLLEKLSNTIEVSELSSAEEFLDDVLDTLDHLGQVDARLTGTPSRQSLGSDLREILDDGKALCQVLLDAQNQRNKGNQGIIAALQVLQGAHELRFDKLSGAQTNWLLAPALTYLCKNYDQTHEALLEAISQPIRQAFQSNNAHNLWKNVMRPVRTAELRGRMCDAIIHTANEISGNVSVGRKKQTSNQKALSRAAWQTVADAAQIGVKETQAKEWEQLAKQADEQLKSLRNMPRWVVPSVLASGTSIIVLLLFVFFLLDSARIASFSATQTADGVSLAAERTSQAETRVVFAATATQQVIESTREQSTRDAKDAANTAEAIAMMTAQYQATQTQAPLATSTAIAAIAAQRATETAVQVQAIQATQTAEALFCQTSGEGKYQFEAAPGLKPRPLSIGGGTPMPIDMFPAFGTKWNSWDVKEQITVGATWVITNTGSCAWPVSAIELKHSQSKPITFTLTISGTEILDGSGIVESGQQVTITLYISPYHAIVDIYGGFWARGNWTMMVQGFEAGQLYLGLPDEQIRNLWIMEIYTTPTNTPLPSSERP